MDPAAAMSDALHRMSPMPLTIRQLKGAPTLQPGSDGFASVASFYLPAIYGMALACLPERPEAAEVVASAVFETFAARWKRLPGKTVVVVWLLQTAQYAIARQRAILGLPGRIGTANGWVTQRLLKAALALAPRLAGPFFSTTLLRQPTPLVAEAFGINPTRVARRIAKSATRMDRRQRKILKGAAKFFPLATITAAADSTTALMAISQQAPLELEARILSRLTAWNLALPRTELARSAIAAWRWRAVGVFARRTLITFSCILGTLGLLGGTLFYLADHGWLTLAFMQWGQARIIKQFPALKEPARRWPVSDSDRAHASTVFPKSAGELFGTTNIWLATIRMNREQWRKLQPHRIRPVEHLIQNNRVFLRNPHATRNGLAGAIGLDFPWSEGALEFAGKTFAPVGIRFRGNGSYVSSFHQRKQPYKIDLDRIDKRQSIAGVTTLNFVNTLVDFSHLCDPLAEKFYRDLGLPAPRTAYVYVTLDVQGVETNQPAGLYTLIEDVGNEFAKTRFGTKATPIFKPVTYDLFADLGDDWAKYKSIYDLKTKASPAQLARVIEFAKLVTHADDTEFAQKLSEFLDVEEYATFLAGLVLLSSYDGYLSDGQNFFLYLDPHSNKFGFIPWDQDISFGGFTLVGTAESRENASIWDPAVYDHHFLNRVMRVEAFRQIYRRKLEEALAGPFQVDRMYAEIDRMAAIIRPAVAAESQLRVERFDIAISSKWASGPRDGSQREGTSFGPAAPPRQLKRFIEARIKSVRAQLDGQSEGMRIRGLRQD